MYVYDDSKPKILMVESDVENLILLDEMLKAMDLDIYIAKTGNEALNRINENDFDLILIDVFIPKASAYLVCSKVKQNEKKRDTPVIFLTSLQSHEDKVRGFEFGVDDYLVKPFYQSEVQAKVKLHLQKYAVIKQLKQLLRHSYHELYNPLAIIETSAQMYNMQNDTNKYVDSMHAAAKSLHVIYEDLYYTLSSDKNKSISEDIDITQFLKNRLSFFSLLSEIKGWEFELNFEDELFVQMPNADLQRIVDNSLSNAIKYAFENTKISVSLSDKQNPTFIVTNLGSEIKITEEIFKQGYREAYEQRGMGIGLEIVSSICHKHNIQTEVVSKNKTTSFKYTFSGHRELL